MQIKINKDEAYPIYSIASDQDTPPMFDEKIVNVTAEEFVEFATAFALYDEAQRKLNELYGKNTTSTSR